MFRINGSFFPSVHRETCALRQCLPSSFGALGRLCFMIVAPFYWCIGKAVFHDSVTLLLSVHQEGCASQLWLHSTGASGRLCFTTVALILSVHREGSAL